MKRTVLCLMVPLLLIGGCFFLSCFQGIDLADEGFWFSNAYVMRVAPDKASYSFGYYLTVAISAFWGWLISDSLISYRFLAVLSKLAIMMMAYYVLRKSLDKFSLFFGLILGGLFTYGGVMCFYGNTCTSLFYMMAVVCAYNWMESGRRVHLLLFGLVLGIGAFARIANLTDALFFLIIPFYRWVSRVFAARTVFYDGLVALMGWILGAALVILMMLLLGHWNPFVEMLGTYVNIAGASESGHSLPHLILCQLRYYGDSCYYSLASGFVLSVSLIAVFLTRKCSNRCSFAIVFAIAVVSSVFTLRFQLLLCRFSAVVVFMVSFALACFYERRPKMLSLWVLAFLCLSVSPLGSDVPGTSNKYCMPLYLPLVCGALSEGGVVSGFLSSCLRLPEAGIRNLRMVLYGLLFLLGVGIVRQIWLDPIRDNDNRALLTTCAKVRGLEHVRTTPERAKAIEDIVAAIKRQAEPRQPLLVFHSAPGLHALTGLLPYTCSTWSFILSAELFTRDIERAGQRFSGQLPVVVLAKWAVGSRGWPQERKHYMDEGSKRWGRRIAFNGFLSDNNYQHVFENDDFIILKADTK